MKSLFFASALALTIMNSSAQTTQDPSPDTLLGVLRNCNQFREQLGPSSWPSITLRDAMDRPISIQVFGYDFTLEYSDTKSVAPSVMIGLGQKIHLQEHQIKSNDVNHLAARLKLFRAAVAMCGADMPPPNVTPNCYDFNPMSTSTANQETSPRQPVCIPDFPSEYFSPLFWSDFWLPSHTNSTWNFLQTERTRPRCEERCTTVVEETSDAINVGCAILAFAHPAVGAACVAGNYIGKGIGKVICRTECA